VVFVTLKKRITIMTEEQARYNESSKKEIKDYIIRANLIDGSKINGRVNINRNYGSDRASDLVANQY